ncbi:hypothetical protein E8E11_007484 [Didymella keratinophila]|nr:hypothetical protein E8E11_007484 [Didymella keratinophila]
MAQVAYEYEPLSSPERNIHIAVLQPALRFKAGLKIKFVIRKLKVEKPAYEALSYVWGSEKSLSTVEVDSSGEMSVISITQNLDVALRYLRFTEEPRYIWVDALCINQKANN